MEASSSSSKPAQEPNAPTQGPKLEGKIAEFCNITGASADLAESLLTACNGSLEMAVNMHMEGVQVPMSSSGASTDGASSSKDAGNDATAEDEVRAPIPQRQERLIGAEYEGYAIKTHNPHKNRVKTVFDGFRNFGNHSIVNSKTGGANSSLEELFRPPLDIMFQGDWQAAKEKAESLNKWLLINIQDAGEFPCQVLNRDVWSSEAVKTVIKENFIFWQQYKESADAQRYMTFYPVTEWPHVSILDPRTGEKMVTWSAVPDANCFCDLVTEFLSLHPSLGNDSSSGPPAKKKRLDKSILDADEEDQIAAAIQASLAESAPSSSTAQATATYDSNSESEIEPFSGEDSNLSMPTPKKRSKANSRAPSPGPSVKKEETTNGNSNGKALPVVDPDEWKKYLGTQGDQEESSKILIRFPDGKRESKKLPSSSSFKAISLYVIAQGYPLETYEIVTNFPRRILTDLDDNKTLKELKLFPQETVFVQQRS